MPFSNALGLGFLHEHEQQQPPPDATGRSETADAESQQPGPTGLAAARSPDQHARLIEAATTAPVHSIGSAPLYSFAPQLLLLLLQHRLPDGHALCCYCTITCRFCPQLRCLHSRCAPALLRSHLPRRQVPADLEPTAEAFGFALAADAQDGESLAPSLRPSVT